jgi:hypothetical protein
MDLEKGDVWLLWCRVCGRAFKITLDDVSQYQSEGWPRCCEETMTMFTRANRDRGDLPEEPL